MLIICDMLFIMNQNALYLCCATCIQWILFLQLMNALLFVGGTDPRLRNGLTSITVVQIGELVPLIVLDEAEEGPLDIGSHLDNELLISIQGEAGRYEGDV